MTDLNDISDIREKIAASLTFALGIKHSPGWPSNWDTPHSLYTLRNAFDGDFMLFSIIVAVAAVLDPYPDHLRQADGLLSLPNIKSLRQLNEWEQCTTVVCSIDGQELISSILTGLQPPSLKSNIGERLTDFGLELLEKAGANFIQEKQVSDYSAARVHKFLTNQEIDEALRRTYQYRPLQDYSGPTGSTGDTDIRLLTLNEISSSPNPSAIEGTLQHVRLGTLPSQESFDAISYVWGHPSFTHTLICSDAMGHLKITERLYRILLKLRKLGQRRFWIDAISINQNDVAERSSQVQQMSKIYRRASRVHAFLATDRELSIEEYLQSEWFTRRWVVQEAIAARALIVHRDFQSDIENTEWETILSAISKRLENSESNLYMENAATCFEIESTRKKRWSGIFSLLLKFSSTKCGDDTDRLFALLSIASDVSGESTASSSTFSLERSGFANAMINFTPDYSASTSEAYKQFAIAALGAAYPFDLLHCAGSFRHHSYNGGNIDEDQEQLPSWVPDWRLSPLYKPLLKASNFEASVFNEKKRQLIEITDKNLIVAGISIGKVIGISEHFLLDDVHRIVHVDYITDLKHPESPNVKNLDLSTDRVSFYLDKGQIVAGPPDVLPDDEVVIFFGAKTPFVVRRNPFGEGTCRLLGDCYIPGAMTGEALQNASDEENFLDYNSDFFVLS